MTSEVNSLDILKGLAEKVIFDQENLILLKIKIAQLSKDEITPKEMKQLILNQRAMILDGILELLPFFIDKLQKSENSMIKSNNINTSDLERKLNEREELLELVAIRIQGLVQGTPIIEKENLDHAIDFSIEKMINKELQVIDIDSWLNMFDFIDLEKNQVKDEFRLLIRLFGNIGLYHERLFEKDDTLPMQKKIKEIRFPIELEKELIHLNKARNDFVHSGKEIHVDDQLLMYNVFFRVLKFLLVFHVIEKVSSQASNDRDKEILCQEARKILVNIIGKKMSKNNRKYPKLHDFISQILS